jgi:dTDP-glucose 4,6-dehydratase
MAVMNKGKFGEVYNIGSGQERKNIDTVKTILKILGKPETLIQFVQDRPGHDFRYALQCSKLEHIGWAPEVRLEDGLRDTVLWNTRHLAWLEGKLRYLRSYWKKVYKA